MTVTNSHPSFPLYEAIALERLANFAVDKQDWNEASRLYTESLCIRRAADGSSDATYALILDKLAAVLIEQGKLKEAMEYLNQALPILEAAFYPSHGSIAAILEHQGDCFVGESKFEEAEPLYKRAADIFISSVTMENRMALRALYKLGKVYISLSRAAEAKIALQKALKYVDTPLGPLAEFRYQLALAAIQLNEMSEAREFLHKAAADFKQRSNYARVADCSKSLANVCSQANETSEAEEWLRQSVLYEQMAVNAPYPHDIFLATLLRA
ncbi:MAG: tetratricopeptide repeat protein [Candidatus Obscuribacterales bacterium]|jgi:tetratricopeptide (TPR) repeat protein